MSEEKEAKTKPAGSEGKPAPKEAQATPAGQQTGDAHLLMETLAAEEAGKKPSSAVSGETVAVTQPLAEKAATPSAPIAQTAGQAVVQLGDFRLVRKLGAGGMGAVYLAHQISLDRPVALKVLFKHLASNQNFIERFYREARILARLDHPHIVRGYSVGCEKGWHYYAMEYIEGGSLQSWLKKLRKLSIGDALYITIVCAEALGYAHENNIVHRDIKPDNILITPKGVIKLADMGLAKALDEDLSLTQSGVGAGTPYYMAPEQARDAKHVDRRSDIYSLGCMLYTLITGEVPFKGNTTLDLLRAKEEGKFPPARRLNPDVPEKLDLIIDKMMAKNPEHRYQTCAELLVDLRNLGLAHDRLSFLEHKPGTTAAPMRQPTSPPTPARTQSLPGSSERSPASTQAEAVEWWYVQYRTPDGKLVERKLTTAQVRDLIRDPDFDVKAQASKNKKGPFRSLASYQEFEAALRSRYLKAKADRKVSKLKKFYESIDDEQRRYERHRWFRNLFYSIGGWVMLLVTLAVAAAVAYGAFIFIRDYALPWVLAKLGLGE